MLVLLLSLQDLLQTSTDAPTSARPVDRSRLDLRLPAAYQPATGNGTETRFTLSMEGDFAWNGFEPRENFRKLLSKNVRDEVLDSILDALVGRLNRSSITLLCQISPTTCDSLKHYRTTTNSELAMDLDLTRSIEEKSGDTAGTIAAGALKACLQERRRKGDSLSEALRHCRKPDTVSNLEGKPVSTLDLLSEVSRLLNLDAETSGRISALVGNRTVGQGSLTDSTRRNSMAPVYQEIWKEYRDSWNEPATEGAAKRTPSRAPPVTSEEYRRIRETPEPRRTSIIESLTSAASLLELTRRVQEAERALETAGQAPGADEATRTRLEQERRILRAELARLVEEEDRLDRYRDTLRQALTAAEWDHQDRLQKVLQADAQNRGRVRTTATTQAWDTPCPSCGQHESSTKQ